MARQQPVDHRRGHRPAQVLGEGRPDGGDHQDARRLGGLHPRRQEGLLLVQREQRPPPPPPACARATGVRGVAKLLLESGYRRSPHAEQGGRLLQGGVGQGRQQHRLGRTELREVLCLGHHPPRFGDEGRIDLTRSGHIDRVSLFISS